MSTQRGIDVSTVKTFLNELREGHIFIARVAKGGRGRKYAYLMPPKELFDYLGVSGEARFNIVVNSEGFVDYVIDTQGDYKASITPRGIKIRFPIDVEGYVVIEPLDKRGFRVYF